MTPKRLAFPKPLFLKQKPMLRVFYALAPLVIFSIYLFGWRALVLTATVLVCGTAAEALFAIPQKKPVTSAVLVTGLIFSLSLPPTVPFWMAAVGITAGVSLGKMVFGGFGKNVFNPAMVGRCFIYITFPLQMTNRWVEPFWSGAGGFSFWAASTDTMTKATPLGELHKGTMIPWHQLFLGSTAGSLGETSALLILLAGAYLIYKKTAPWRLALSCLLGGLLTSGILRLAGLNGIPSPLSTLLAGSFLFGAFFVVTEPVSGAKTRAGQWIYGSVIGALIVTLRGYSHFSEGVMFSVLLMNAFVPLLDQSIRQIKASLRTGG